MILTLDIGNTSITCGLFDNNSLINRCDFKNLHEFLKFLNNDLNIEDAIISSVVPDSTIICKQKLDSLFNIKTSIINYKNCNLKLSVDEPETIGIDRLCNIKATSNLYKTPAITIDFGTATTFDVINAKGHFLGGAIATGLETSAQYLFNNAALLEKTSLIFPENIIGKNTAENIQSGIMYGTVGQVEGIIERIKIESSIQNYSIILTGGLSPLISKKIKYKHILDTDLTLKGIFEIYKQQN